MFLNKSVAQPLNKSAKQQSPDRPDYAGLIQFLIQPFLESPEALKVDCEISSSKPQVWVRLAIDAADKGRLYGRGGRNLQAIRTVLTAAATAAGQSVYLDIYGESDGSMAGDSPRGSSSSSRADDYSRDGAGSRTVMPRRQPRRAPHSGPSDRSRFSE